jgi:hypothetical protein
MFLLSLPLGCSLRNGTRPAATVPSGWVSVAPPKPDSEAAVCANWTGDTWQVALATDGAALVIRPDRERFVDTAEVPGGRLTAVNHGEFGGEVWWEPSDGARERVASVNLVEFVPTRGGLLGLTGLAHLGTDHGELVRFDPQPGGGWSMRSVLSLGSAPHAYAPLADDTLLVVTTAALVTVHPSTTPRVLHRNDVWPSLYANSVVRDRTGVTYIGMRSAVAAPRSTGRRIQGGLARSRELSCAPARLGH